MRIEIEFMRGRTFFESRRCYDDSLGRSVRRIQGRLWFVYVALVI